MTKPLTLSEVDFSKLELEKPNVKSKKTTIRFKYDGDRFLVQLPVIKFRRDIMINKNVCEWNIPINCLVGENTEKLKEFLSNLDRYVIEKGKINCLEWFKQTTQIKYKSVVRIALQADELYKNGVFKLKNKKNDPEITLTKNRGLKKITIDEVPLRSNSKMAVELVAIWIIGTNFGVHIKPAKMDFRETVDFADDSDEEDEDDILDTEMESMVRRDFSESSIMASEVTRTDRVINNFVNTNNKTNLVHNKIEEVSESSDSSDNDAPDSQSIREIFGTQVDESNEDKVEQDKVEQDKEIENMFKEQQQMLECAEESSCSEDEIASTVITDLENGIAEQIKKDNACVSNN